MSHFCDTAGIGLTRVMKKYLTYKLKYQRNILVVSQKVTQLTFLTFDWLINFK